MQPVEGAGGDHPGPRMHHLAAAVHPLVPGAPEPAHTGLHLPQHHSPSRTGLHWLLLRTGGNLVVEAAVAAGVLAVGLRTRLLLRKHPVALAAVPRSLLPELVVLVPRSPCWQREGTQQCCWQQQEEAPELAELRTLRTLHSGPVSKSWAAGSYCTTGFAAHTGLVRRSLQLVWKPH